MILRSLAVYLKSALDAQIADTALLFPPVRLKSLLAENWNTYGESKLSGVMRMKSTPLGMVASQLMVWFQPHLFAEICVTKARRSVGAPAFATCVWITASMASTASLV